MSHSRDGARRGMAKGIGDMKTLIRKPYWLTVSVVLAVPVLAGGVSTEALMKRFYAANLACNGIHNECPPRDRIIAQLEARGYCFVGTSMADLHFEYAGSRALCAQMRGH